MRRLLALLLALSLAGCDNESRFEGPDVPLQCSNDNQKQYVLDNLYYWYLWNDMLPPGIDIADYPSPEVLVQEVTETNGPQKPEGGPLDRFSYVGSAQADQEFFGEGRYEGFGFSWRLDGADMRFSRVFVSSPAFAAGFSRGQTILRLDGRTIADIEANEGISAALDNDTVEFEVRNLDLSTFIMSVTKDIVTINPIPQYRTIAMGQGEPPVGYMEFATFISTAHDGEGGNDFDDVFAAFIAAGVEDVIIDLRYNGGGLVDTANLLADHLGGFSNDGQIFTNTEFNADRSSSNGIDYFANRANAINLNRLIIIASRDTASASELVINGLDPFVTGGVYIVGDSTFGKPVGQIGLEFCEKILRPTTFRKSNAAGFGDYFDGLPVDCTVADDLDFPVGDASDPNMVAALSYVEGAGCPVASSSAGQQKADFRFDSPRPDLQEPPQREFAGAY
jgi:hypothetical protein